MRATLRRHAEAPVSASRPLCRVVLRAGLVSIFDRPLCLLCAPPSFAAQLRVVAFATPPAARTATNSSTEFRRRSERQCRIHSPRVAASGVVYCGRCFLAFDALRSALASLLGRCWRPNAQDHADACAMCHAPSFAISRIFGQHICGWHGDIACQHTTHPH